jgi:hypothetical protein
MYLVTLPNGRKIAFNDLAMAKHVAEKLKGSITDY